ncbi:hypothetical protein ON010_g14785 [Phytophthora cinnamomi]|nr:hypothetical protein ON010_g14785 [Phytophthora cinnamomi]
MASETYTSVASPIQHAARRAFVLDCVELTMYKRKCQKTLQLIGRWFAYQLQKMDVEVQVPEAGFYLFPCFRRHRKALALRGILTDEQLCAQLLQDTGVAILPGSAFGRSPEELFARLAFVDFKGDLALYLIESMQRPAPRASPSRSKETGRLAVANRLESAAANDRGWNFCASRCSEMIKSRNGDLGAVRAREPAVESGSATDVTARETAVTRRFLSNERRSYPQHCGPARTATGSANALAPPPRVENVCLAESK